jgi:hypothetical protein
MLYSAERKIRFLEVILRISWRKNIFMLTYFSGVNRIKDDKSQQEDKRDW